MRNEHHSCFGARHKDDDEWNVGENHPDVYVILLSDHMQDRQLIFESVLPSELDPARFSRPIIDGVEQALTGKATNCNTRIERVTR